MAINTQQLLDELEKFVLMHSSDDVLRELPVLVNWPDQEGTGSENRQVLAVHIENSGTPEQPMLVLVCGPTYSDDLEAEGNTGIDYDKES